MICPVTPCSKISLSPGSHNAHVRERRTGRSEAERHRPGEVWRDDAEEHRLQVRVWSPAGSTACDNRRMKLGQARDRRWGAIAAAVCVTLRCRRDLVSSLVPQPRRAARRTRPSRPPSRPIVVGVSLGLTKDLASFTAPLRDADPQPPRARSTRRVVSSVVASSSTSSTTRATRKSSSSASRMPFRGQGRRRGHRSRSGAGK